MEKLVIGGMQTDFCVDTTCRQAATHGYDVLLVADAHSTVGHEFLKADQIIAHRNRIMRNFTRHTDGSGSQKPPGSRFAEPPPTADSAPSPRSDESVHAMYTEYLKDREAFIPELARLHYEEWGYLS